MAMQQVIDISTDLNNNDIVTLDVGGWDYAELQLNSPTGTFNFLSSNDAGAITGVSDGNATSATNFIATSGTNISTGSGVTSLGSSGIVKFSNCGQFLRVSGESAAQVTSAFVRLYKIN